MKSWKRGFCIEQKSWDTILTYYYYFLMEARGTKKSYQNSFLSDLLFMQENVQLNLKKQLQNLQCIATNFSFQKWLWDSLWLIKDDCSNKNIVFILLQWHHLMYDQFSKQFFFGFLTFVVIGKIYLLINWPLYAWLMVRYKNFQPGRNFWGFEGDSLIIVSFFVWLFFLSF